tara:strand:+ start:140 stop:358 length:219 start_codon:yes stop_codon:yes gene_type:complete
MTYNNPYKPTKLNSLVLILCDLIDQQEKDSVNKHISTYATRIIQRKRIIVDLARDIKWLQNEILDNGLAPKK